MNYYPHHIGDYRSDTAHLSNEEDLAYRRLLEMYYDTEQPIPLETHWVARRLRVVPEVIQSVLNDFFFAEKDGFHHSRCDQELAEYHRLQEKNRANGKKGGRPKAKKANENNPLGYQSDTSGNPVVTHCEGNQEPITNNQEEDIRPLDEMSAAEAADPGQPDVGRKVTLADVQKVVGMYHAILPELPQVRMLSDSRKTAIKRFILWVISEPRMDGTRRALHIDGSLGWIGEYFNRARDNDFLMGRNSKSGTHSNWVCDLDFLLTEKGKRQVIEKTTEVS